MKSLQLLSILLPALRYLGTIFFRLSNNAFIELLATRQGLKEAITS